MGNKAEICRRLNCLELPSEKQVGENIKSSCSRKKLQLW